MTMTNGWFWKVRDFSLFACSFFPHLWLFGMLLKITNQKENSCQDQCWIFQESGYCGLWLWAQLEENSGCFGDLSQYIFLTMPIYTRFTSEEEVEMGSRVRLNNVAGYISFPSPPRPPHMCLCGANTEPDALEYKQILEAKCMVLRETGRFCRRAPSAP